MTVDGDSTRERLLQEARDLYLAGGLSTVSVREVARRAGVSAAAVYRHFDGRTALLRAVCATGFGVFGAYLMRSLAASNPRQRMLACADQYLAFALDHPQDYRVMFMSSADELDELQPNPGPEGDATFQFLVDRVSECQANGALAEGDPTGHALSIWAHVHGLASLWIAGRLSHGRTEQEFRALYADSTRRFLAGLGCDPA
jgi:AcrR family transcriptional regulator